MTLGTAFGEAMTAVHPSKEMLYEAIFIHNRRNRAAVARTGCGEDRSDAPDAGADLGVASPQLFENCNGADAGGRLQHRDDLAIPNIGKRVGPAPATRRFLPGWQARIILDPVAGRRAETGFGGSYGSVVGLSVTHVQPHLVVGYVEAGQGLIPQS